MTEPRKKEITVGNVASSAAGGAASAVALSYFGATGSLIGAAVGPVVFLLAKELVKGPTERAAARVPRPAVRVASASPAPVPVEGVATRRRRRRPSRRHTLALVATALLATLVTIAAFTLPEVLAGRSLVSDRESTFFTDTPTPRSSTPAVTPTTTTPGDQQAPAVEGGSSTTGTTPLPAGTTPEPAATTPVVPAPTPTATTPASPAPAPTPSPGAATAPAPATTTP